VTTVTKVAVLGTGIMGAGMARSLARAGLDVVAWNRSPDKARPLAADGIAKHPGRPWRARRSW
jgi:3-hydroxyisobutyrate dehydrogenase